MVNTAEQTPHISVAPMMDWTDRHCRYFLRQIAPNVRLYTEMVTTGALLHGDAERFLRFDPSEHPVALQLGGSDPTDLGACAKMGADYGYDEINLNCGCPSDRVQKGMIGAILMTKPDLVARCVEAMAEKSSVPVTVKCRIGVDDQDDFEFLDQFVDNCVNAGAKTLIVHARKCWLKGLSPKQNREIPPLDYGRVQALKEKYPQLVVILNGGIKDMAGVRLSLDTLDGAMIGREAYQNPYFLAEIEQEIFNNTNFAPREVIAMAMAEYAARQFALYQTPVKSITRHMMGLFHQEQGAKNWRRALSTYPYEDGAGPEVFEKALSAMTLPEKLRISA